MTRFRNAAGPQIQKLRQARQWTQSDLAVKLQLVGLDMDRTAVAKIEARIRSVFDFELAIIAKVLGVSMNDLTPEPKALKRLLPDLMAGKRK